MAYFEKLAANFFRDGPKGEVLYYPSGVLLRGRIIPNREIEAKAFKLQTHLSKLTLLLAVPYCVFLGLSGQFSLEFIAPIFLFGLYYHLRQYFLVKELPKHSFKPGLRDALGRGARLLPKWYYWFWGLSSAAALVMGLSLPFMLSRNSVGFFSFVLGTSSLSLLGLALSFYLYKLRGEASSSTFSTSEVAQRQRDFEPRLDPPEKNDVNPVIAVLIIFVFIVPIGVKFLLAAGQADQMVASYYLSDGLDGSLYVQINNQMLRVNPKTLAATQIDYRSMGINNRTQMAFFNPNDVLLRKGDWEMSPSLYVAMGDSPDPEQQKSSDEIVGDVSAKETDDGSGAFRCRMDTGRCTEFHQPPLHYPFVYNVNINRDSGVFITEGIAHKIHHYSSLGHLIATYDDDLRFPKRVEFQENGDIYFANTNRNRIERMSTRTVIFDELPYSTFGNSLAPLFVDASVTGDEEYIWPLAVKYFSGFWWVINMGDGMRYGKLMLFEKNGSFIRQWPLPDKAEPRDLLLFEDQLLISDSFHGKIYRVDAKGTALEPWTVTAIHTMVETLNDERESLRLLDVALTWLLALLSLAMLAYLVKNRR